MKFRLMLPVAVAGAMMLGGGLAGITPTTMTMADQPEWMQDSGHSQAELAQAGMDATYRFVDAGPMDLSTEVAFGPEALDTLHDTDDIVTADDESLYDMTPVTENHTAYVEVNYGYSGPPQALPDRGYETEPVRIVAADGPDEAAMRRAELSATVY